MLMDMWYICGHIWVYVDIWIHTCICGCGYMDTYVYEWKCIDVYVDGYMVYMGVCGYMGTYVYIDVY